MSLEVHFFSQCPTPLLPERCQPQDALLAGSFDHSLFLRFSASLLYPGSYSSMQPWPFVYFCNHSLGHRPKHFLFLIDNHKSFVISTRKRFRFYYFHISLLCFGHIFHLPSQLSQESSYSVQSLIYSLYGHVQIQSSEASFLWYLQVPQHSA